MVDMTKTLREKYFSNEILKIGDVVEDSSTGESLKIIDRGSNYITVDGPRGVCKKWLNEVKTTVEDSPEKDFTLTESGQIKLFGYETRGFDSELSEFVLEQFSEFDDLYSKHQIIKLLDSALSESDLNKQYELLERVSNLYSKQTVKEPILIEGMKNDLERKRIAEILATVAGSEVDKSVYKTATNAVAALKAKYTKRTQWEVLWPFLKLAKSAGIAGITQNLPFNLDVKNSEELKTGVLHEELIQLLEDNFEELVESLEEEDLVEAFDDSDTTDELLFEVLSYETRVKLGMMMKAHKANLATKRARALTRGVTTDVLQSRARRLAEVMLKRRMFRKAPADMTRQEKERFEKGASRRKAIVAKLAQRLIGRVRMMQSTRMHSQHTQPAVSQQSHTGSTQLGAS